MSNDTELDSIISEMAPETVASEKAAAPAPKAKETASPEQAAKPRKENFDEAEYENEEDDTFDPDNATPEQRKAWPKKYANALARRDKNAVKSRSELSAAQQKISDLEKRLAGQGTADTKEVKKTQAATEAVIEGKPKLEDFKDWGTYNEALVAWNSEVSTAKAMQKQAEAQKVATDAKQQQAASAANEARIDKQAKELVAKNPQYLEQVKENADILDNFPQHVTDAFITADHPEIALMELMSVDGALEALGRMSRDQAIAYIAKAEAIGMQKMGIDAEDNEGDGEGNTTPEPEAKRVSSAPLPMKAAKNSSSGKRTLDKMYENGDDKLFEELGI